MSKAVTPTLGANSFTCPHCGAIAAQHWYNLLISSFKGDDRPWVLSIEGRDRTVLDKIEDEDEKKKFAAFIKRVEKNEVTFQVLNFGRSDLQMVNMWLSNCYSCKGFSVWIKDEIVYPETETTIELPEDLPAEMRSEVMEARAILDKSPRGAAALLRLSIENLMPLLDAKAKTLDESIGILVQRGLSPKVQKALDVVRVIGNNAVHPGQIEMTDNKEMAITLFRLIKIIVESMITHPTHIDEIYGALPERALKGIERRDTPKAIEDKS
jgi:hypothetical protein